jgi:hypothetical protein
MVRALFGETVADMVDADRDRIGREIEGRWDCYEAAVLVAATVRKKPTNPLPYLLTSALRNVREGIGSEADAARRKLAAKIKVEEGRASAEAERRRPVESDPELSREEEIALLLAQLREWSPRNPYRPRAERRLAELGHGKQDPSPTN